MNGPVQRDNRIPIAIAVVGIVIELVAVYLLASKRVDFTFAQPLIIVGMLMAFVPLFVAARRARRRR